MRVRPICAPTFTHSASCCLRWPPASFRSKRSRSERSEFSINRGQFQSLVVRGLLIVRGGEPEVVYVLHAFQKKSPSGIGTAKRDVKLVAQRLRVAQEDYEVHHGKPKR